MKIKEAQDTVIYVTEDNEVIETNLYDHVMISQVETTSPRGVEGKNFIENFITDGVDEDEFMSDEFMVEPIFLQCEARYITGDDYFKDTDDYHYFKCFGVYEWSRSGNRRSLDKWFLNEQDAGDYLFNLIYEFDFAEDDQRSTWFTDSKEEAETVLAERNMDH